MSLRMLLIWVVSFLGIFSHFHINLSHTIILLYSSFSLVIYQPWAGCQRSFSSWFLLIWSLLISLTDLRLTLLSPIRDTWRLILTGTSLIVELDSFLLRFQGWTLIKFQFSWPTVIHQDKSSIMPQAIWHCFSAQFLCSVKWCALFCSP